MRTIKRTRVGEVSITLHFDKEWNEYQVCWWPEYLSPEPDEAKTYFTDDKQDALGTFKCMVKEAEKIGA